MSLRQEPAVIEVLHAWWATAQCSVQQARAAATELHKREYIQILVLVGKALLKDCFESEARREAEKDWAEDSKDAKTMTRECFMDAIFELADHWSNGVSSAEYAAILRRLLKRITLSEDGSDDGKSVFWKQLRDVCYQDDHPVCYQDDQHTSPPPGPIKSNSFKAAMALTRHESHAQAEQLGEPPEPHRRGPNAGG